MFGIDILLIFSENSFHLLVIRLFSSKAPGRKDSRKPSKTCHVSIHWIALLRTLR